MLCECNFAFQDYTASRIKKGLRPLSFRVLWIKRIENSVLSKRFDQAYAWMKRNRSDAESRIRIAFHVRSLCFLSLLLTLCSFRVLGRQWSTQLRRLVCCESDIA